jgi:hypothetical protein
MSMLKQACRIHLDHCIHRYLMSNSKGRMDGHEKAMCHAEMCSFYVAVVRGHDQPDRVRHDFEADYQAVHTKTQELTDNLDTIGFPLDCRPDYEELVPLFFERFHALALEAMNVALEPAEEVS